MTPEDITSWLVEKTAAILQIPPRHIDPSQPFASQGLDSMGMLELTGDLAAMLNRDLQPSLIWEHPTIQALASHLSLTMDSHEAQEPPISPVPRVGPLPQTFAQERMWRGAQVTGPDLRQTVTRRFQIAGDELDVKLLEDCVKRLIMRHEGLRTTFGEMDNVPVQIIHPSPTTALQVTDLSDIPDGPDQALQLDRETRVIPFDLATGPLARFSLYILGKGNYFLTLHIHHILCDGESNRILVEDLCQLYQNGLNHAAPDDGMPPLTVQNADFAVWQRQWLKKGGKAHLKNVAWWNDHLGNIAPPHACDTLKWAQPPEVPDASASQVSHKVPGEQIRRLRAVAVQQDSTFTNILYTALLVALARHGTPAGALVGSYVSDRLRAPLRRIPGLFVNLVAMRMPEGADGPFFPFLAKVTQTMRQIAAHQDLAFEELVNHRSENGLYAPHPQIIFNSRRGAEMPEHLAPGLSLARNKAGKTAKEIPWGMNIIGTETDDRLNLRAHFDTGLYDPGKVRPMFADLVSILDETASL